MRLGSIALALAAGFGLPFETAFGDGAGGGEATRRDGEPGATDVSAPAIENAIRRGVRYLVRAQNRDGSWGSARRTKSLNVYAPVPGAHHAFRTAVTALCLSALIELNGSAMGSGSSGDADADAVAAGRREVAKCIRRGREWLVRFLPRVKRATPDAIYNVWAHAYAAQALAKLQKQRAATTPEAESLETRLLRQQIDRLVRYESVDGGWGYYDFRAGAQRPGSSSTSFVTATVLVALEEARDLGLALPEAVERRAVASIQRLRKPDSSYIYGEYLKWRPMHPVNRPGGSLGRSQACNLALRLRGDAAVSTALLKRWLKRLLDRNLWLDIGRKRPVPHESWFAVAGYFYYYGHYYAARSINQLPPPDRSDIQRRLAARVLPLQEKDGSWWDYPLYDYHQAYGTAYALMTLRRCLPPPPREERGRSR